MTVYIGGIAAVILELAEPRVRHGVWDHSVFPTDPLLRLRRTGLAAMVTFYGAQSVARKMIAGVNQKHAAVRGQTDRGVPYQALDQDLLTWVQTTAAFGFVRAFDAYARPLNADQWGDVLRESQPIAEAYGVQQPPVTKTAMMSLLSAWEPQLETSDTLMTFLRMMREQPTLPPPGQALQPLFVRSAVSLIPEATRQRLGLASQGLRAGETALVKLLVRGSRLISLRNHPASLARQRTHKKTAEA
ncbi:MAG: DUF2236 domain-containing protein [Parvularculaceae bacterium]|nr:DUF2236 domain-containing protein [Parvularculaceae bacterium]